MTSDAPVPVGSGTVRLDKWLVAARIYKTRTIAQCACDAGHVTVNERPGASARAVRVGDLLEAKTEGGRRILMILRLEEKRGPAALARGLYDDRTPPTPPSEDPVAPRERGAGRPTKRDRREIDQLHDDEPW